MKLSVGLMKDDDSEVIMEETILDHVELNDGVTLRTISSWMPFMANKLPDGYNIDDIVLLIREGD